MGLLTFPSEDDTENHNFFRTDPLLGDRRKTQTRYYCHNNTHCFNRFVSINYAYFFIKSKFIHQEIMKVFKPLLKQA
jgi:hypothetical protein